jgi:ubiquinone/menaquinone biosynthesis C-methylase UbiE
MAYLPTGKELIDPYRLLEEAGVANGHTVIDFGCGTLGHYVFPASKMVGPNGKVIAVDILKSVLSGIESRIKLESATNVTTLWGDLERVNGVKLPDGTADVGLLINNLFLSQQKEALVRECVRMVKAGSMLVVVDWKPSGISLGPAMEHRVPAEEARKLAESVGLTFVKELHPGEHHYGFLYRK